MIVHVTQDKLQDSRADTIIVNLFEGVDQPGGATRAVDTALSGAIRELIADGDFKGKSNEVAVLYPRQVIPAKRVLVVGLGKAESFDLQGVRKAAAAAIKRARSLGAKQVATIVHGAGIGGLDVAAAAQATVEGSLLALYRFAAEKQRPEPENEVESVTDRRIRFRQAGGN